MTDTPKPEALVLADYMSCISDDDCGYCNQCRIAAELRRQHEELELQKQLVAEAQAMTAKVCAENEALRTDAERYRHMRNLAIEQTGIPGQPCIAVPNGMKSGYYLTEENADFAVDASMAAIKEKP